ncbi:MAG: ABC transporter permease [Armatimonadota bacterium]|nr:ABC transporter permease [Armatimonadota bacterium]MDR7423356.1 ABC transporter permease [Armatimonadota bacterium]MDR7453539.1 ABC transporter permease [Armatimonadota bacterium]MDR7455678.1 ABC transporter permease [Armatimonadota bacterium]MDR7497467.1 ABC transporter permease [Armatimonadota bacterium]
MPGSTRAFATREAPAAEPPRAAAGWRWWARRFVRNRVAPIGLAIIAASVLVALVAPAVVPHDIRAMSPGDALAPPGGRYPFGTDEFGRDVFSRVVVGSRISLVVAFLSVAVAVALGTTIGLAAGYYGGWWDAVSMRAMDIVFAFPAILLAIAIMAVLGTSLFNLVIAIGVVYTPQFARVSRAAALAVRSLEFVDAARALGLGNARIVWRHIIPNVLAPVTVQISLSLSLAILSESALSFLGLGTQPPTPSWGNMLSEGRQFLEIAPWNAVFPGLAIMVVVLGFNLLGDGLRDLLDPRLR